MGDDYDDGPHANRDVAGHELTTLPGVSGRFSPIAPVAMTATESGVIRLWDLRRTPVATDEAAAGIWGFDQQSVKSLAALSGPTGCAFRCVSPDGSLRASSDHGSSRHTRRTLSGEPDARSP